MHQKNRLSGTKLKKIILLFLMASLVGCKNEQPQAIVTTPTPLPAVEKTTEIDPPVATALAQITPTSTIEAIVEAEEPDSSHTETPEFQCEPPENWVAYIVRPNDTLIDLANSLGISIDEIKSANCMLEDSLTAGEPLFLPAIPVPVQVPSVNQPVIPVEPRPLPVDIPQELAYGAFGGGGCSGPGCICTYDGVPGPIFLSNQAQYSSKPYEIRLRPTRDFVAYICEPATDMFTITLILPTGELIPLELNDSYLHAGDLYASYELPLGHAYGEYRVILTDYPEPNMITERQEVLQKGTPTWLRDEETGDLYLYYFEPNETVHLAAYDLTTLDHTSGKEQKIQLLTHQTYQVNEKGYLIIDANSGVWALYDPTNPPSVGFAVFGEESGFISYLLYVFEVINNGSETLCRLSTTPVGTEYPTFLSVDPPIESGEIWQGAIRPGYYDIEAFNCDNELIYKETNVEAKPLTTWIIP